MAQQDGTVILLGIGAAADPGEPGAGRGRWFHWR